MNIWYTEEIPIS